MRGTRLLMVRDRRIKPIAIHSAQDVFVLLRKEARRADREYFWRLDLDARHVVVGMETVSKGTLSASLVHPREFYKAALLSNAAGVIAVHNHPSGDAAPSFEDKTVTKRLREAGDLLGIPLLDHIVLTDHKYFSFRDGGLL